MANLFIAYDLDRPGQDYGAVESAIKSLGTAVKVQLSLYYVKTSLSAKDAEARVWAAMDGNDRLIVIEAIDAWWHNNLPGADQVIQQNWRA